MVDFIDKVVAALREGRAKEINCGGDVVGFEVPGIENVTVRDLDLETGFDQMDVTTKDGKSFQYARKKFSQQFKSLDDYIGKECAAGHEVIPAGLGKKRERKVAKFAGLDPEVDAVQDVRNAYRKEQLPEQIRYNEIKQKIGEINGGCNGSEACEVLKGRMEREVIQPLEALQTDIGRLVLKYISVDADGFTAEDKAKSKIYNELAAEIEGQLIQLRAWGRQMGTDSTPRLNIFDLDD